MDHVENLTVPTAIAWEELTTEPFLLAFAEEVGVTVSNLELSRADETATASMDWSFETDRPGIPDLAKRFLPAEVHLRWTQTWQPLDDARADGGLEVLLIGRPSATTTATSLLLPVDAGSTLTTTTRTKADLPFPLAGRVESMIDKDLVGWILSVQARVMQRRHAG